MKELLSRKKHWERGRANEAAARQMGRESRLGKSIGTQEHRRKMEHW